MPPMNCERAVFGLMTRPTANTPSTRLRRTSPLSASTRTSTNCAPNAWRESSAWALISSPVWTETSPSPCASSASHARTTAVPHEAVPIEPPATAATPKSESPISSRRCSGSTPSASAAIWVRTVRAPVPMSVAAISTV